jgi:hypothetical protein
MTPEELMNLLTEAGFDSGWALLGTELSLWEHEQDPPTPLERPNETPSAES